MRIKGQNQSKETNPFNIEILCVGAWQNGLSYITATLPFTWFSDHEGSLPKLVERWCEWIRPYHGYAGAGIIVPMDTLAAKNTEPFVYELAKRFPGLEVDIPVYQVEYLKSGIKGVNWLTILGQEWVQSVGGVSTLLRNSGKDVTINEFEGGLVIQTGPDPQFGDMEDNNVPEAYRKVSGTLKSIRIDYPVALQHVHEGKETLDRFNTQRWFKRFD